MGQPLGSAGRCGAASRGRASVLSLPASRSQDTCPLAPSQPGGRPPIKLTPGGGDRSPDSAGRSGTEGPGTMEKPPEERRAGSCWAEATWPLSHQASQLSLLRAETEQLESWQDPNPATPAGPGPAPVTCARDLGEEALGADLGCHLRGPGPRLSGHTGAQRDGRHRDTVRRLLCAFGLRPP